MGKATNDFNDLNQPQQLQHRKCTKFLVTENKDYYISR